MNDSIIDQPSSGSTSVDRNSARIGRSFFARETKLVAREIVGKVLVSNLGGEITAGIVVESEAYLPTGDSACHAFKYRTPRTEVMFGPAGKAYVYPIHAKFCFNAVTGEHGEGCAVLIRALEPVAGLETMRRRRGLNPVNRLTRGPGCLCQALGIDRSVNDFDLTRDAPVWFESSLNTMNRSLKIASSVRIGVTSSRRRRLRFYVSQNRFVSGPAAMRQS